MVAMGGYQVGGGRPRKRKPTDELSPKEIVYDVVKRVKRRVPQSTAGDPALSVRVNLGDGLSPAEFLLAIMRDESQDLRTRMQAAVTVASYVHARPAPAPAPGKKEIAAAKSQAAQQGTDWEDLLN